MALGAQHGRSIQPVQRLHPGTRAVEPGGGVGRSRQQPLWQGLALAFLLGGTLGNGIDRWKLGHVTDFIEFVPVSFPIFNGADIAINLAVICFVIDALSRRHEPPSA